MDCPGEYLKRERELREASLDDISKEIRVPVKLLRALEADDYSYLPHATFVKGFIRAYCKYLGVDENDALLRYELYLQEIAEFEEPAKKSKPLDVEERNYPVRSYLTLTLVAVGIIIIAGVYYLSSTSEEALVSEKQTSLAPVKEEAVSVKTEEKEVEMKAMVEDKAPVVEGKKIEPLVAAAPKVESVAESQVEESAGQEQEAAAEEKEEKEEAPAFVTLPALTPEELTERGLQPGEHLLRAHAKELTWVKITTDYAEPFEVMLKPGERAEWKAKVFFCS